MSGRGSSITYLGSGSAFPVWLQSLERDVFSDPWGRVGVNEGLWAVEGLGYAQWLLLPAINEGELLRIAVVSSERGHGVGRHLLRESQQGLAEQGITVMRLEVRRSNRAARHLYESEGWREAGCRRQYYQDGEDAILYELEIGAWC